jgi:hypothetical protein
MVINPAVFVNNLFLRPQYQHYYFGDYYDANYQAAGFYPSYSYNSGRYGYDPIYAHQRWEHRQDGQWEQRVAADFQNRRDHADARPPRTWAAQSALSGGKLASGARNPVVAVPFAQFTKSQSGSLRFQPVDKLERQKLAQQGQEVQRFGAERQKLETTAAASSATPSSKAVEPARGPLPRSPIVARPAAELGQGYAPPRTYEAPKPDFRVQPTPRVSQPAPQPQRQPEAQRQAPQPRANAPAGPPSAAPNQGQQGGKDRH